MTSALLDIEALSVSYLTRKGEISAVIDFSTTVAAGESVGLVGESGCGKSTVAMAIMRYLGSNGSIVGGSVRFKGADLSRLSRERLRRIRGGEIAMIYQEPMAALNPSISIGKQLIEVPVAHQGISPRQAKQHAINILRDVQLPDAERILQSYPHQLSGGQQQRVVIAMALLGRPSLLLLDEPTTALDVTVEAGIVKLIEQIRQKYATALVYISHNLGLIRQVCDRVAVMYSGEIVEQGPIEAVFNQPRHPYTLGLFDCIPSPHVSKSARPLRPIPGHLPRPGERPTGCNFGPRCEFFDESSCGSGPLPLTPLDDSTEHRVRCTRWQDATGTGLPPADLRPAVRPGEPVLQVVDLHKYYEVPERTIRALLSGHGVHYVKANNGLSFNARRAETVAIVGESGCGKSTLAKVLMGLETATRGSIEFEKQDLAQTPVRQRSTDQLASMQMIFQDPSDTLNPSHTIGGQIGRVIKKFGLEPQAGRVRERVLNLLQLVQLPPDFYHRKPRQLSGGQKQRAGIARAFAGNPDLVVADEPVSALDVSVAATVIELLMDIQRSNKTTLLFISHDLSVVRYVSDRVVVMYLGKIMEAGASDAIFAPPYHPYTEALLSAVPVVDPNVGKREIVLKGSLPSITEPVTGCPFHTRCPRKIGDICEQQQPPAQACDDHVIHCHIPWPRLEDVAPVFEVN